jgi:uncharacterized protein
VADAAPAPVRPEERIVALDALRGVALCGILLMNLPWMSFIAFNNHPLLPDPITPVAATAFWAQHVLFEGTMRGLFSMLFGAGILLFMAKGDIAPTGDNRTMTLMLRRLLFLGLFGIIDMTFLLWPGDILTVYAIAGLLVLPLRGLSVRRLLIAGGLVMALNMAWGVTGKVMTDLPVAEAGQRLEAEAARGVPLGEADAAMLGEWRDLQRGRPPSAEAIATEREARLGDYGTNLAHISRVSRDGWFVDWQGVVWIVTDSAAFMLFGMALFKLGLLQGGAPPGTYWRLLLIGYGFGLPLRAWATSFTWAAIHGWSPTAFDLITPELLGQPGRLLVTLGHLGLFHLAYRAAAPRFAPLAALGRMAFTGYLGQSVLAAMIFSGFGLALWGQITIAGVFVVAAIIWAIQIPFAVLWFRRFPMGPMEWVWRWLTYGGRRTRPAPA